MWGFFLFCFVVGGRGISNELGGLPVVYLHGNAHDFLKKNGWHQNKPQQLFKSQQEG